jgi:excisionase family DNA binding protein
VTELLTIKEAARVLNTSVETVRRLVWSNQIGFIDLNKGGRNMRVRFEAKHIDEFLRNREVKAR